MKLRGKVAIVTGAASGIGLASARLFAQEGARVVVVDIQEERGQQAAREIVAEGGDAVFARVDMSREAEVRQLVENTVARWNKIDVLFNNAGVVLVKPLEDMSEEEWDRMMAVNVKATFLAIKHVVPVMRRAGGGAILNTGSIGSMIGQLNTPAYIATKGAIALLSKTLALDYGRDHIRVNCLCPGITDTPMLREHLGHGPEGEAKIRQRLSRVPTGEILRPEDIARAALYLVCDDSVGVTGINHLVDGGMLAAAEYNVPLV
jgi:NAD(P)-dependent dehydrogenase (short-subunit alcohol dehydrogenase family)